MSIVLIGYRGSGKTTLGRALAQKLEWGFADLDERIVEAAEISIREIFNRHGEAHFRQLESQHLLSVLELQQHVISLGGGAVLAEPNRQAIRSAGHTVVYLRAEPEELHRRILADPVTISHRPGLTHLGGSVEEVRTLLAQREPLYQELKNIELDVNGSPTELLVERLVALLPR